MSASSSGSRQTQAYLDWEGNHVANWTMTSSKLTDPVDVVIEAAKECIPLYPLRYGLTEESCRVDGLDGVTVGDYPAGPASKTYGLRLLRPRSIVYLFYSPEDSQEGQPQHHVYQVTHEATFVPLPRHTATNAAEDQAFTEQRDFWFPMGVMATPWVPAPKHDVTDTVYLLVTDTLLTPATLADVCGRLEELSGTLLTKVVTSQLAEGQQDVLPLAGTLDNAAYVPEMRGGAGIPLQPADLSWSESRPDAPLGSQAVTTLQRFFTQFNGNREDIEPLVPILHDPVGVMSELNHRLATQITALSEHCADSARKLRVKEMIERLGDIRYDEISDRYQNFPIDQKVIDDVKKYYDKDISSETVANALGDVSRRQRLANYRADDAKAFLEQYEARQQQLVTEVETAAAEQWSDWQGLQQRYHALLELFDETDDTNFLDLRVVVANTLTGLFHDDQGQQWLQSQFEGETPVTNSVMYRALMGHPLVNDYVTQDGTTADKRFDETLAEPTQPLVMRNARVQALIDNTAGEAMDRLQRVIDRLPDDAASSQLGMVIAAVTRNRTNSSAFWRSPSRAILEVLFGEAAIPQQVPANRIGEWFAQMAGGSAEFPFRPTQASNDPFYLVGTQKLDSRGSQTYSPLKATLKATTHFWHGVKGMMGGLGMWAATDSLGKAIHKLGDDDGKVLANSLNLGSAALATGASGTGLAGAGMGWA
ncbi:toxin VasX [Salinicola aestuarinus]|uniref:toxin VasX n=1 Tax=Salinicola aestuarinus TaxID=1949082 RepID=UPI000DA1EFCA|nr:toxin VasX [Salinicola aestuarinus]